ncbi:MAG: phosphoglycolate phosphatase [Campylobacterota bacterium]|nr:phosphoglycolate phosphatase [Campylobacterota bacterium]
MFIEKELLLFDLDGTLIDSAPDLALSINYMLRSINHNEFSEEVIDSWVGNGAQTLVKRALSGNKTVDENIDKELFDRALSIFLEYYKNNLCVKTTPYPNVKQTLEALKDDGYKLAIITNKPFDFIEPILEQLALNTLFELSIGGDSLPQKKPSPLPLQYICKKFNVKARNTLMIGDSKNDILAAKAAGIESIGVSYGYNYGEDIRVYEPNYVVDDFADILKVIL